MNQLDELYNLKSSCIFCEPSLKDKLAIEFLDNFEDYFKKLEWRNLRDKIRLVSDSDTINMKKHIVDIYRLSETLLRDRVIIFKMETRNFSPLSLIP